MDGNTVLRKRAFLPPPKKAGESCSRLVETNFGGKGKVGPRYMLDDFDEYFKIVEEE